MASAPRQYDVFVSHAGEEKDNVADPLAEALAERGLRVFFDRDSLRDTDIRARDEMTLAAEASPVAILVICRFFLGKEWPVWEAKTFLARAASAERTVHILPYFHATGLFNDPPDLVGVPADSLADASSLLKEIKKWCGVQRIAGKSPNDFLCDLADRASKQIARLDVGIVSSLLDRAAPVSNFVPCDGS